MIEKLTEFAFMARCVLEGRMEGAKDRGASALEYVGMLVIAAVIVGAIASVINAGTITGAVTTAVNTILGTGGG